MTWQAIVRRIEGEISILEAKKPELLSEHERQHLLQLGTDFDLAWSHRAATAATRKRILRAALYEVIVRVEGGFIGMQGGDHTALGSASTVGGFPRIPCR